MERNALELPASATEVFKRICSEKRTVLEYMLSHGSEIEKIAASVILSTGGPL